MHITNKPGLSACWIAAVSKNEHDHLGDRSMTEILSPIRVYQLKKRHSEEFTEDVSDCIWSMFGTAIHYVLEKASGSDAITEQRFQVDVGGFQLSVCPDRVEKIPLDRCVVWWNKQIVEPTEVNGKMQYPWGTQLYALRDFKISQVYARNMLHKEGKGEWTWQINGYAWALCKIGFPIVEASIEILMKDWDWKEANLKHTHDYPPYQVESIPVQLYCKDAVEEFLAARITEHMAHNDTPDNDLPYCTLEERWGSLDLYAVKKAGGDKAMSGGSKFRTKLEAENFIQQAIAKGLAKKGKAQEILTKLDFEIEFRKGESKRCERYCLCKGVCNQYMIEINPAF